MADRPLTAKMEAFVREYLSNGRNAAAAYRASYNAARMSPPTIDQEACRLLKHPKIAARVGAAVQKVERGTEVSVSRVVTELSRVAFSDPRALYNPDGTLKPPSEWDDDTAAAVAGVEVFEEFERVGKSKKKVGETRKVKRWDKNRALDSLAKHLGMYGDRAPTAGPSITIVEVVMPPRAEPKTVTAAPLLSDSAPSPTTIEVVTSAGPSDG